MIEVTNLYQLMRAYKGNVKLYPKEHFYEALKIVRDLDFYDLLDTAKQLIKNAKQIQDEETEKYLEGEFYGK